MMWVALAAVLGVRIPGGYVVPSSCITALSNGGLFNASDVASGCGAAGVAQPRVQASRAILRRAILRRAIR